MQITLSDKSKKSSSLSARFQGGLIVLCLLAIAVHFILKLIVLPAIHTVAVEDLPLLFVIAMGGIPLCFQIIRHILRRDLGADMLAAIALAAATWLGEYVAAVLIIIMLSGGQALEVYAMRQASSMLRALADRMPSQAHRRKNGQTEEIDLLHIAIGDELVIYPYETTPVDGVVVEGHGSMDESYLTGEPYQVSKTPGVSVLSGAINGEAVLVIRAEKRAKDSRYAQIMEVMREAEQKRPTMRRLGDRIGAIFGPFALLFAITLWYLTGESERFLAVLVVATPCPLLIAIPMTLMSAISMAAKRSIIIKDPTALEQLPTCRTAIFDKTGTLTYGNPELTEILTATGMDKNEILQLAASLEHYSKHPLATAILQAANKAGLKFMKASQVFEKPGQGLRGIVNGITLGITHRRKLLQQAPEMASGLPPTAAGLECIIMKDNRYAATFRFRDAPRPDGKSFIDHLASSHHFNKVMLVSGDRESEVFYLAEILGIKNILASQSPEQKVSIVRAETAKAPTLFMGDGINDAPALASATVGIAFGQHSAVTGEAAGVVILENTLVKVDELLHIAGAMRRIVLQSAIGGMALSVIAMGLAAAGYVTPVAGALLQEAIDSVAIVNALRLTWSRRVNIDLFKGKN